jgi:hypothetical protein
MVPRAYEHSLQSTRCNLNSHVSCCLELATSCSRRLKQRAKHTPLSRTFTHASGVCLVAERINFMQSFTSALHLLKQVASEIVTRPCVYCAAHPLAPAWAPVACLQSRRTRWDARATVCFILLWDLGSMAVMFSALLDTPFFSVPSLA